MPPRCLTHATVVLAAVLGVAGTAAAAGGSISRTAGAQAEARTIVVGDAAVAGTFDTQSTVPADRTAIANLYDRLVVLGTKPNPAAFGGGSMIEPKRISPSLATSWKRSNNGTVWAFTLRQGVKSNYGHELTADDVKWTYDRAIALRSTAFSVIVPVARVVSIAATSKYVVTITTSAPSPVLLPAIATQGALGIIDSTEAKTHVTAADPWARNWLSQNPAGFGPYTVASWTPTQQEVFKARPDYWGPKPFYSQVTVLAVPDVGGRLAALQSGSIQLALGLTTVANQTAAGDSKLKVVHFAGNIKVTLYPNYQVPQFQDRRVRQAMASAINYAEIIKGVYYGKGEISKTPFAPYLDGATDRFWRYQTNIAKAKSLMAAAGYANGFGVDLFYANERPELGPITASIQQSFAQIGITVTLVRQPEAGLISRALGPHNLPLYISNTAAILLPDGSGVGAALTPGVIGNVVNYNNPTFTSLYNSSLNTVTGPRRIQIFYTMQKIIETDLPIIPLITFHSAYAMQKAIQGFTWSPDGAVAFWPLKAAAT